MTRSEIHLIILWEKARYKQKEIFTDIQKHLILKKVFEIKWTPALASNNFSRFYGIKLPHNSGKERNVGTGAFLCLIVEDKNPKYEFWETSRGHEYVNQNIFVLKLKYRSWVGGSRIHTTNSVEEVGHDSALLLGLNYEDLKSSLPEKWDGKIHHIRRDLTGAKGWKDLSELFYTLNATINYVILRNAEILPLEFKSDLHGDIDLLTDDYPNMQLILNASPVFKEIHRVHHCLKVGKNNVLFDFRYVGDNYYCEKFECDLLNNRILNQNNIYICNRSDAFYSLIYHALIHKRKIAPDYYNKIFTLFLKLGLDKKYNIEEWSNQFDLYFKLLEDFMEKRNYTFVKPLDKSVFYSEKITQTKAISSFLEKRYKIKDINIAQSHLIAKNTNLFLSGYFKKQKIFLKVGHENDIYRNEYNATKELYNLDSEHFVYPILYRENKDISFVALQYVEGCTLDELMLTSPSTQIKIKLIEDIFEIFTALKKSNFVHRDIRPQNFIFSDGILKLIDFQLAVSKSNYRELNYIVNNHLWHYLGAEFAMNLGIWDDAYSLLKILEFIGCEQIYENRYLKIHQTISQDIGTHQIQYIQKQGFSTFLKLMRYKIKSKLSLSHEKRKKYREKYKTLKAGFHLFYKVKKANKQTKGNILSGG